MINKIHYRRVKMMVPGVGLEPTSLSTTEPKSVAFSSFAIRAHISVCEEDGSPQRSRTSIARIKTGYITVVLEDYAYCFTFL